MITGTASTLELSDRLEQHDEIAATTSPAQKLKSILQTYMDLFIRPSGNTVVYVGPSIAGELQPTTKPRVFGPVYSETVFTPVRELAGLKTLNRGDWEPPTDYAYRVAVNLAVDAYFQIAELHPGTVLPTPFASTDDSGGVRIAWRLQGKQVRVNIGGKPELRSYIYFQSPAGPGVETPQAAVLADRLYWLVAE